MTGGCVLCIYQEVPDVLLKGENDGDNKSPYGLHRILRTPNGA